MISEPFVLDAVVDYVHNAKTLGDTGCNVMAAVDSHFVSRNHLPHVQVPPREINAYDDKPNEQVNNIVRANVNIGGVESVVWMYEVKKLEQDIILGLPWLAMMNAQLDAADRTMFFKTFNVKVPTTTSLPKMDIRCISAAAFITLRKTARRDPARKLEVFSASLADVKKALRPKERVDPRTRLPKEYWKFLPLFDHNAESLPPTRGKGIQ